MANTRRLFIALAIVVTLAALLACAVPGLPSQSGSEEVNLEDLIETPSGWEVFGTEDEIGEMYLPDTLDNDQVIEALMVTVDYSDNMFADYIILRYESDSAARSSYEEEKGFLLDGEYSGIEEHDQGELVYEYWAGDEGTFYTDIVGLRCDSILVVYVYDESPNAEESEVEDENIFNAAKQTYSNMTALCD